MIISKINDIKDKVEQQNFSVKLFDYQLAIIKRMKLYETMNFTVNAEEYTEGGNYKKNIDVNINTDIGILGDRTGTGKTLSILGLINDTINDKLEYNYLNSTGMRSHKMEPPSGEYINTTIIFYDRYTDQWLKELKRTGLRYKFVDGVQGNIPEEEYKLYDVVLVPYKHLNRLNASFNAFPYVFKRVILDNYTRKEAKCKCARLPRTYFTWYVTDEYKETCKKSYYFKKILDVEILVVKCHRMLYNNNKSEVPNNIVLCKNNSKTRFSRSEADYVKYLIDNLNYDDIIHFIGGDFYTKEQVIHNIRRSKTAELQRGGTSSSDIIRFINNRIPIIQQMLDDVKNQTCCICLEDEITHPVMLNCCYNTYCNRCMTTELLTNRGRCPNCKSCRIGVIALCEAPAPSMEKMYDKLYNMIEDLSVDSRFLIITDDNNLAICIKHESSKYIETLRLDSRVITDKFNRGKLDGLVIKDDRVRGVPFEGVTDIFFTHPVTNKFRKKMIYSALNATNVHVNIHTLSYRYA